MLGRNSVSPTHKGQQSLLSPSKQKLRGSCQLVVHRPQQFYSEDATGDQIPDSCKGTLTEDRSLIPFGCGLWYVANLASFLGFLPLIHNSSPEDEARGQPRAVSCD